MAIAGVVAVDWNRNDSKQRATLWGNGRVDTFNAAVATDTPDWTDRTDQPVAVAIHVVDWEAMSGYILDKQGAFHAFGGAPQMGTARPEWGPGNAGEVVGVPYWNYGIYKDWSWDEYHPGRGVVLDGFGTLHNFGGAPAPFRTGYRWSDPDVARKLAMSWGPTDMRAYTLDFAGGIHADYSAAAIPADSGSPYWRNADVARDLVITDWDNTPKGYTLDHYGGVHHWGGAEAAIGGPYLTGGDWARTLEVLNLDDPLQLWQVWAFGQEFDWKASTKPVVTAGGIAPVSPASSVTTTTRPMLSWVTSDAQKDSQAAYELAVFTEAFAAANPGVATNPWLYLWNSVVFEIGNDPNIRGIKSPVDLANGGYRMYIRVMDTSELWSDWATRSWTMAVPIPARPIGLTAVAEGLAAKLTATMGTADVATLLEFQFSADNGVTWTPVRGADAVPRGSSVTVYNRDAPLGVPLKYRVSAYSVDPRTRSLWSASQPTVTVPDRVHALTAVDVPGLGGVVMVDKYQWSRPVKAGIKEGIGAKYPTVISDGRPKARRTRLTIWSLDRTTWDMLEALVESDSVLVHRDPFGEVVYCKVAGEWTRDQVRALPEDSEGTPLRHAHTTDLPLIEVRPPNLVGV